MRRHLILVLACSLLRAQKPSGDEQKRTIDAAREVAIHYNTTLPNFICNEQIERTDTVGPSKKVDRLTIELTYSGKESYRLVAMNGQPTKQAFESLDGLITGGEFGSLLLGIFDPSSAAAFQWKESTNLRKRAGAVYSYKIVRAKSHYILGHRDKSGKMIAAPAGYHGEVVVANQTGKVLRLTAVADESRRTQTSFNRRCKWTTTSLR